MPAPGGGPTDPHVGIGDYVALSSASAKPNLAATLSGSTAN